MTRWVLASRQFRDNRHKPKNITSQIRVKRVSYPLGFGYEKRDLHGFQVHDKSCFKGVRSLAQQVRNYTTVALFEEVPLIHPQ